MITHLACIMDGNRRWARKRGLAAFNGHRKGIDTVKLVAQFCLDIGIKYLSLYTMSIENMHKRSELEKKYLFDLIETQMLDGVDQFLQQGVRIHFVGDRSLFPESLLLVCEAIEEKTNECDRLQISVLLCYGAQQEVVSGVKKIIQQVKAGLVSEDEITPELLAGNLWMGSIPAPDLIVRTGGHKRLSNFLLFQAAYSEFYFFDCLWPELTVDQLHEACGTFKSCVRNFGV